MVLGSIGEKYAAVGGHREPGVPGDPPHGALPAKPLIELPTQPEVRNAKRYWADSLLHGKLSLPAPLLPEPACSRDSYKGR
jgi:hypothetical protein